MAELDDLKAADAALDTTITDAVAEIQRLVAKIGTGVNPTDLVPVTQDLTAKNTSLADAVAASKAAVP